MIRVGVVGATGYAGAELVRILAGHPEVELTVLTSRQYAGRPFAEIYPALTGVVDRPCEAFDADRVSDRAELVFTSLPHKLPMDVVPALLQRNVKVVDLSADFRFRDVALYEAHYQPHTAAHLLGEAVYGLSEVYGREIARSRLVGNPGCYPTSVLLPLVPLLKAGLLDPDSLVADAKSGVSGAGRSPSLTTLYSEVTESFKPYKVAEHRHNPEMDQVLGRETGRAVHISFVPHLVPMSRGMQTTIYARPSGPIDRGTVIDCLRGFYANRAFVRLRDDGPPPNTLHVRGTNYCDIGFRIDPRNGRLILMSAIDNLVKGAAGQAVQNMNLMFGLEETAGLRGVPYPL